MSKEKKELTDPGDHINVNLKFTKNLGNYESMAFGTGVTVTRRDEETDEEAWKRAWQAAERELDEAVERAERVLKGE